MRVARWLTIVFGAWLVFAKTSGGDEGKGKEIFSTVCSACHGPNGGGNQALLAPSIAGLDEWYIVLQLDKFRAGWRGFHSEDVGGQRFGNAHWRRSSVRVVRHSQRGSPRERQLLCIMAPSKSTSWRSSSEKAAA